MQGIQWGNISSTSSRRYTCAYCGNPIASEKAYIGKIPDGRIMERIYICHHCGSPTHFDYKGNQTPNCAYGNDVRGISTKEVEALYNEARACISSNAYVGSILCSRKLLMNIAVSKKAKEGLSFIEYIEYLSTKGYIPPDGKEWVEHIKDTGNEATHEIAMKTKKEAEELIDFLEMLLKFIYEFPARMESKQPAASKTAG